MSIIEPVGGTDDVEAYELLEALPASDATPSAHRGGGNPYLGKPRTAPAR